MTDTTTPRTRDVDEAAGSARRSAPWRWRPWPDWFCASQLIHLIYLGNLAWQPAFNPTAGWLQWGFAGALVVLYVPLFVLSFHPRMRVRQGSAAATTVLAVVGTLFNVGASTLFVYAVVTAVWAEGRRAMRWLVGATVLLTAVTVVSFIPWPYQLLGVLPGYLFIWVLGLQTMSEAERQGEAERLRIENVRIEQLSAASERERIARDMHDVLGHSLTGLVVRAQLVQSLLDTDPDRAGEQAAELEGTARQALAQLRAAVTGLNQMSLADEVDTARRTLTTAGLSVDIDVPADSDPDPLVERSLALALREAVTNVVRHADARRCQITLSCHDGSWHLEIVDDGVGSTGATEGNGLRGMRERITAVGGHVERATAGAGTGRTGQRGTHLTVTVPM